MDLTNFISFYKKMTLLRNLRKILNSLAFATFYRLTNFNYFDAIRKGIYKSESHLPFIFDAILKLKTIKVKLIQLKFLIFFNTENFFYDIFFIFEGR